MSELVVDPKDYGLEESSVVEIEKAFLPKIAERDGYLEVYNLLLTKEITKETCDEARGLRLKLVKVRTGIADIHKTQKAYFLRAGQFVDAWKNKETLPVEQMEENLEKIEKHFKIQEAEKIQKLSEERKAELLAYTSAYLIPERLGEMPDSIYQNYLIGIKVAHEAKLKADAEVEVERLRLIEIEKENARVKAIEDERIRKENEKLKAEAIEREKKAEAERKRQADLLAKQKAEADEKARIEAEKQAAILAKERADAKAKQDAIEEAARIEREKAEAERRLLEKDIADRKEAERKAKEDADRKEAERIAAEKRAMKAPDKTKMALWIENCSLPELKLSNRESIEVAQEIDAKFESFKKWALSKIEAL